MSCLLLACWLFLTCFVHRLFVCSALGLLLARSSADLHPDTNEADLHRLFSSVAGMAPVSIRICRDFVTRKSLGYAYVNFPSSDVASAAMGTLNYSEIRGKKCRMMWSQRDPNTRRNGVGNLFVKNLPPTVDSKSLADVFNVIRPVASAKVVTDEAGKSRGYGYVTFFSDDDARTAVATINGMEFEGRTLDVAPFVPRKEVRYTPQLLQLLIQLSYTSC